MCLDMCVDVRLDMCLDMCVEVRLDTCLDMCGDMCVDMCIGFRRSTVPARFRPRYYQHISYSTIEGTVPGLGDDCDLNRQQLVAARTPEHYVRQHAR